ncbi:ribonuclease H [Synechococcus phage S-WAM1]|jgi:5'-3' exonuclease|uniref:Ribonuclease H n=1 Tax=Synechococcus phage S-WAM1 TaxID=1815521 RepID=A0A1D8KSL4_9CAUD|nr:ribonuclease H [Synechococcus phage S-WAM1]AOV61683.1 ribonuclease H [Synechococcus phage S-WAM1]
MILVDMNQVCISNLMVSLTSTSTTISEGLVRHMVLNSLRFYRSKFGKEYGELVLCYDSKNYWRRKAFPYYKGTRKRDREKSKLDWNEIFEVLNHIRDEIREFLPYKVIDVDGAEADDVIASLVKDQAYRNIRLQNNMQPPQKVLILSGDKDFQQLQKYRFVDQYNPIQKKFVQCEDPKQYLLEHIIKGDRGDGIPNYLSDDDTFVEEKRQRPISKLKLARWVEQSPEEFCNNETLVNYERNRKLIDFECIPDEVHTDIINMFESSEPPVRGQLYVYFARHELNEMLDNITDF